MRRVVYVVLSIVVAAVVVGVLLIALLRTDATSDSYETFDALQRSESWEKGWVPGFIPQTATDIYEEHDLDTNAVYGEFSARSFSPDQTERIRMLGLDERARLIDSMPVFGVKRRIGDRPVFVWCSEAQTMRVYLYVRPSGRVVYWGDAAANAC